MATYAGPLVVVHVPGYMLALAHQGQERFRVWVVELGGGVHEQYIVSLVDMARAIGVFANRRDSTKQGGILRALDNQGMLLCDNQIPVWLDCVHDVIRTPSFGEASAEPDAPLAAHQSVAIAGTTSVF